MENTTSRGLRGPATRLATRVAGAATLAVTAAVVGPAAAYAGDVPNPSPQAPPGVSSKVDQLLGFLKWGGIVAVVAGIIIAGIMMVLGQQHGRGGREGLDKLWYVAGGAVLIGGCSSIAGWLL